MRASLTLAATLLTVAGLPAGVRAQADAFVASVRELAAGAERSGPAAANTARAAAPRLRAALVEWDRRLGDMQAAVDREARAAADRARILHIELGVAYRLRGRLDAALREFDAAATQQPAGSDLLLLRALTLEAAGRTADAGAAFNAAFAAATASPVKAYYAVRRSTAGTAARATALRALMTAYERLDVRTRSPVSPPFLPLDAVPDTLSRTPVVADAALRETFAHLAAGRYDDAVAALETLEPATRGANDPRALLVHGQRDEAENRIADARLAYRAALDGTLTGRHALLVALARLAQVDGDTAAAIEALAAAARLAPNEPAVHKELAGAFAADGRRDDAFAELMAALLIAPGDAQAHAAIGGLFLDDGRDAEAVVALTRAIDLAPARHETRYALARALTRLGRTDDAARQFALFEAARREALERRRRDIASEVEREETLRGDHPAGSGAR